MHQNHLEGLASSPEFLIQQVCGGAQELTFLTNLSDAGAAGSGPILWDLLVYHEVPSILETHTQTHLLQIMTILLTLLLTLEINAIPTNLMTKNKTKSVRSDGYSPKETIHLKAQINELWNTFGCFIEATSEVHLMRIKDCPLKLSSGRQEFCFLYSREHLWTYLYVTVIQSSNLIPLLVSLLTFPVFL